MHARSFGRKPAITQSIFLFKWALGAKNVLLGVLNNFATKLFVISLLYRSIWLKIDFSRMPKKKQSHKTPPTACDFRSKTAITQSIFIFERRHQQQKWSPWYSEQLCHQNFFHISPVALNMTENRFLLTSMRFQQFQEMHRSDFQFWH